MQNGCDFVVILGEEPVVLGDNQPEWEQAFMIHGQRQLSQAFLIFNLRHLTYADVAVSINDQNIGKIYHHDNWQVFQEHWFTQMIHFDGRVLKPGKNVLQIAARALPPDPDSDNAYDDFDLKDVICFFK